MKRSGELKRKSWLRSRTGVARTTRETPKTRQPMKTRRSSKRFAARRDPAYKAWIVTLRCVVTGRPGVDPAHVRSRNAGGDDRGNIVPLIHALHEELHQHGIRTFERKYGVNLRDEAARLLLRYETQEDWT